MTLKVCRKCRTRAAHSLDTCPQCQANINDSAHGTAFMWDYEVDNMLEAAAAVEAVGMKRPKDTDNVDLWRKFGAAVVDAAGNPADSPDVKKLDKEALIELFG